METHKDTPYCYKYERPALGTDSLVIRQVPMGWEILTIERQTPPFQDRPALPGGFFDMADASVLATATRELAEETNLTLALTLLGVYANKDRDPRGRTISVAYWAELADGQQPKAGDDALSIKWLPLDKLPPMAFDHNQMCHDLLALLQGR